MLFQVMNRQSARKYSFQNHGQGMPFKYVIISISDVHMPANQFNKTNELVDELHLFFDDVEKGEHYCMQKEDAIQILDFMNKHMDVDECVVQCEAGISRSAAICAALMLIIEGSDKEIFENPKYCPNRHCYRLLLDAYFGSYDEEAIDEKFRKNIELWRKANGFD